MRLYYPVLLVAAVAIASTNVLADGDGEERSNFGEYEKIASFLSDEVDMAPELEVAPELEALVGDSSKGKGKYPSSSLLKSMKKFNPFRGSSSKMKHDYGKLKKDKRSEIPEHPLIQELETFLNRMTLPEFLRHALFAYWEGNVATYTNAHNPKGYIKESYSFLRDKFGDKEIMQAINSNYDKDAVVSFKDHQTRFITDWTRNKKMDGEFNELLEGFEKEIRKSWKAVYAKVTRSQSKKLR
ncbi:unnamed protein product [Peronospora farinosa]|uniref:RxLR effector protein n=1 Tax=Peronospora farinosa TaxID=134698 RepID=A0AAV0UR50_9STRA|nr:unnamed protein product [Peronospora farinosa]CAI5739402.1 unnamed protein product [Peronospora farinosa]